LNQMQLVYY